MVLQDDADRVKHLLAEAISVLCKNGLSFETELSVEGLLGITLDNSDIFLVNINETITNEVSRNIICMWPRGCPLLLAKIKNSLPSEAVRDG